MKKMIVLFLTALMLLSTAACSAQNESGGTKTADPTGEGSQASKVSDEPIDGGWSDTQSVAVSSEVKKMFDRINETMTGAYYEPIAYLSSQVVAGTNHMVLCKMLPSTADADALGTYVIVTVYEDLEGNAEITQVLYSNVTAPAPYNPDNPVSGGWSEPDTFEVTDKAKAAVEKAFETVDSVSYQPVALLGTQVVAGMNYLVLCKPEPQTSGSSEYAILTVYADLQGGAEATDTATFSEDAGEVFTGADTDAASASSQAE